MSNSQTDNGRTSFKNHVLLKGDSHTREEGRILRRKLLLKRQGIELIKAECGAMEYRLSLLAEKERLEDLITDTFDSVLSRKLDALTIVLETYGLFRK